MAIRDVEEFGRIRYVEPTSFFNEYYGEGQEPLHGTRSDAINHPYENYCMAVDLSIKVADRYSCGLAELTNEQNEYVYSTTNGTISFLGGTKISDNDDEQGYLTTNFTDVSMTNPEKNTTEMLGIESISISYETYITPVVVIKFVDVRGATIMQPSERGYFNPQDCGITKTLYKALFSFPYPIFTLKVKGFYGNGVTYKLSVEKTDFAFDASTGNFNITVKFIGHMFRIYADLPMTYLAIAPYTEVGQAYWQKQISSGSFVFRDKNGQPTVEMCTIPDLRLKIAKAALSYEAISAAKEGESVAAVYEDKLNKIDSLIKNYPFKTEDGWYENEDALYFIIDWTSEKYLDEKEDESDGIRYKIKENVAEYIGSIREFEQLYPEYGNAYTARLESVDPSTNASSRIKCVTMYYNSEEECYAATYIDRDIEEIKHYRKYIEDRDDVYNFIKMKRRGYEENAFYVLIYYKDKKENISETVELLKNLKGTVFQKQNEAEKEYKDKSDELLQKALGFIPSIKNMYNLAFAHMETFMHFFYYYMTIIKTQLEGHTEERRKSTYFPDSTSEADKLTDTESSSNDSPNYKGNFLPPFAAIYQKSNQEGVDKTQYMWPGDLPNGVWLEEVNMVNELLNASKAYAELSTVIDKAIEKMTEENKQYYFQQQEMPGRGASPTGDILRFIPLTSYDFYRKDYMANPYLSVKKKIDTGNDSFMSELLGIFAIRMYYYLASSFDKRFIEYEAKAFGILEAINVFKALGDNVSKEFINFIEKYADDKNKKAEKKEFLECIQDDDFSNPLTVAWRLASDGDNNGTTNISKYLFWDSPGDTSNYCLYEQDHEYCFMPMEFYGFDDLKKTFQSGNESMLKNNKVLPIIHEKCLNEKCPSGSSFNVGKIMDGGTFVLWEDRTIYSTIYDNIEEEIRNTENKMSLMSTSYEEGISTRAEDEYGEVKRPGRLIPNMRNNIGEPSIVVTPNYVTEDGIRYGFTFGDIPKEQWNVEKNGKWEKSIKTIECYNSLIKTSNFDFNGETISSSEVYILYPTIAYKMGNEFVPSDVKFSTNSSLYSSVTLMEDFKKLKNVYEKAYVFLLHHVNYTNISVTSKNGLIGKLALLVEGAYYWREKNENEDTGAADDLVLFGKGFSCNVEYNTPSRKEYLRKYFEEWATSRKDEGFDKNINALMNPKLYYKTKDGKPTGRLRCELLMDSRNEGSAEYIELNRLMTFLRDLDFTMCTVIDFYSGMKQNGWYVSDKDVKKAFKGFMLELDRIYSPLLDKIHNPKEEIRRVEPIDTDFKNKDLKLSTYLTLKSLYDKWLCSPPALYSNLWELGVRSSDFNSFIYADSFYHDIGDSLLVNTTAISTWLSHCLPTSNLNSNEGQMMPISETVYEFLTEIAQDCGGLLLALPQKFGMQTNEQILDMFKPKDLMSNWNQDQSSFIFLYTYKPSEHLGDFGDSKYDMNGWSPYGDGFSLTDADVRGDLFSDEGYTVPAFGVTFAKQNQSIFKNITLNSENAGVTEASIAATAQIAAKGSDSPRESTLFGQDIYKVFTQYAYGCSVTMMGDMEITPLMYFQLNNVPMWRGAYMIQKVTHEITAGNIETSFEGFRVNKNSIPIAEGRIEVLPDPNGGQGSSGDYNGFNNRYGMGGNGSMVGYKDEDITREVPGTSSPSDVTSTDPIICLSHAHYVGSCKASELAWSTKLVGMIEKGLKDAGFTHVVICNQDGGYGSSDTRKQIEIHGSNKVISVVPHWNACKENYYLAMVGHKGYDGVTRVREDSKRLAACFVEEAKNVVEKASTFKDLPKTVVNGVEKYMIGSSVKTGSTHFSEDKKNGDGSDWAARVPCACILTENWFYDFGVPDGVDYENEIHSTGPKESGKYSQKDDEGRFIYGRGWLESEGGMKTIANLHINAIKKYCGKK